MSGWKSGLLALALSTWMGTAASAQQGVPGGWAPQFSYQTFVARGAVGGGVYLGYGYGIPGAGFSPYGMGGFGPTGVGVRPAPTYYNTPSSQAVNALNPLINTIRRSTRPKGGR
jgi:hypothetical protein